MKFYPYSNENKNYSRAISLSGVRSVERDCGNGKSAIRFSVCVKYSNGTQEILDCLFEKESKKVFDEIVNLLNGIDK